MLTIYDGYYLKLVVTEDEFNHMPDEFLISGCTDKVKYMCANESEITYLSNLGGCDLTEWCADYFKIVKEGNHDEIL